jgi:hypothetical protein
MLRTCFWLLMLGLVSCGSAADEPSSPPTPIQKGVPEGLGKDINAIRAQEEENIIHQMPGEVTTRVLTPSDSTYFETTYFSQGQSRTIYAAELLVRTRDVQKATELYDRFSSVYTVQFGKADTVEHALQWINNTDSIPVEIALHPVNALGTLPALKLTYYQTPE